MENINLNINILEFIFGFIALLLILFSIELYFKIKKDKTIKKDILKKYGKELDIEDINYKMDSVSSYFKNINEKEFIDDITWNDLSMDDIYKKINNTQSTSGREVLYNILRIPLYEKEELIKRDNLIEYFMKNPDKRFEVQYILAKLGISNDLYTTNCLINKSDNSKSRLLRYTILSYIPIISLTLIFFNRYFILLLIASATYNVFISQRNERYNYNVDGFTYMISLINATKKITNLNINEINDNLKDISRNLDNIKHIRKKSLGADSNAMMDDMKIFSEYMNLIFLKELKRYEKVKSTVIKNADDFKAIYDYVGTIDALIAIASFRDSLDYYSKPNLEISTSKYNNHINFVDIYHPLIKKPVSNSANFDKNVLITGSNASGKSTFIKTIAINAILAQTIYTTTSREYNSSYFNIYTSMALKDDIFSNESYYIVEIKSLKRIIDNSKKDIPCLCFVDEILRGTNTIERIASSCEVLSALYKSNTLCFAATHDIELTHILEDKFENCHFEETITNKDIKFDYKLHKGRSETRNAIRLLEFMGYDKNIVIKADEKAKNFLLSGKW
ncbi:DNA mismatch repair protein MutS [Romboutsia sp. 1001216sp1]|nr:MULTISPECIES: DNA mismatch repair protein MutS [unclassified Romboutsia]MDB8801401.1 DNA mismatch repair protein MutS [Romboutsia sp. 1001216sp1]MDB8812799.1 DNA mismatch repair protein MutS [Romboutsia sp. 1001216sp1]